MAPLTTHTKSSTWIFCCFVLLIILSMVCHIHIHIHIHIHTYIHIYIYVLYLYLDVVMTSQSDPNYRLPTKPLDDFHYYTWVIRVWVGSSNEVGYNVVKTIINHPFGNGAYHLFLVILGMVNSCFNHIKPCFMGSQTSLVILVHQQPLTIQHHETRGAKASIKLLVSWLTALYILFSSAVCW